MTRHAMVAVKLTLVLTIMLGVAYPLAVTGIAQIAFPRQANGSLIVKEEGTVIGSELIAQRFDGPEYFHPRPSSASNPDPYPRQDKWISGGSNLGPTSKALRDRMARDVADELRQNPDLVRGKIPVDMVTASASGLDPDISPANAFSQVARVAKARGISRSMLTRLVTTHVEKRTFGLLGEPRANVLRLNLDLDAIRPLSTNDHRGDQ
jgi:potassium-transporting ATPase KdpC subunit